jgi:hypothetical protein
VVVAAAVAVVELMALVGVGEGGQLYLKLVVVKADRHGFAPAQGFFQQLLFSFCLYVTPSSADSGMLLEPCTKCSSFSVVERE